MHDTAAHRLTVCNPCRIVEEAGQVHNIEATNSIAMKQGHLRNAEFNKLDAASTELLQLRVRSAPG